MANSTFFLILFRFLLLLLVQVLIFNKLNYFGFINPMVYLLFLYWYPIKENRALFIFLSFLLGLCVDIFSDTMAVNAAATATIAYARPTLMRSIFGVNYEFQSFKINNSTKAQQFTFLALLIVLHHAVYFALERFDLTEMGVVLKKTLVVGLASLILCILFSELFSTKKE
ncbi:rod shape-determining protein MreD [Maribacter sp. 2307ULW6-5]|uniref:rod shape-determining protein MreD n=1 Tax=Maribacter sp. 2307ULW6-5 TaxID=3386275 RepID=UPI0039BD5FE9